LNCCAKNLAHCFSARLFKLREPRLDITREHCEIYLPYGSVLWGRRNGAMRVLDAVRRRIEGAKASAFSNSGSPLDAAPHRSCTGRKHA